MVRPDPRCGTTNHIYSYPSNSAEGFIMDDYCLYINLDSQGRGRLLDTNDITLTQPERHTVHCLVDIGVCNAGPFFILKDPSTVGGLYTVQYKLNNHTKLLALARSAGRQGGGCRTCLGGTDGLERGLRAEVIGVVTHLATAAGAPPRIDMTSARVSNSLSAVCAKDGTCLYTPPLSSRTLLVLPSLTLKDPTTEPTPDSNFWASLLVVLKLLVSILVGRT